MPSSQPLDVQRELLETFTHNGLVNEYLVSLVPAGLWRAAPPGGRGRNGARPAEARRPAAAS